MEVKILHPRPNPIIAALYTLRDLDVDLILIHGPAGCGFRASRLLEEDGIRVITTAMTEKDLIFGAKDKLIQILKRIYEKFAPQKIGIVGTCASMIIGEDLSVAFNEASIPSIPIIVDVHGCKGDNTKGAILTLEQAHKQGLISENELKREINMLNYATKIEKERGMAGIEYIAPEKGQNTGDIAHYILQILRAQKPIFAVLNAKKETAYLFADIMLSINEAQHKFGGKVTNIANLDENIGLPRIKRYARDIITELTNHNIKIDHITGGLDEYSLAGKRASEIIGGNEYESLQILIGIPHAIFLKSYSNSIAITNGPREVLPLRNLGCRFVGVEFHSHSAVMGTRKIIPSKLGICIRKLLKGL